MEVKLNPIEIIVDFKKDGNLCPIRFRVMDDEAHYQVIHVRGVKRKWKTKVGREIFSFYSCKGIINNMDVEFELKFEPDRGQWTLYRM